MQLEYKQVLQYLPPSHPLEYSIYVQKMWGLCGPAEAILLGPSPPFHILQYSDSWLKFGLGKVCGSFYVVWR